MTCKGDLDLRTSRPIQQELLLSSASAFAHAIMPDDSGGSIARRCSALTIDVIDQEVLNQ